MSRGTSAALALVLALFGCAGDTGSFGMPVQDLLGAAGLDAGSAGLDDPTIVAGLKEALEVGTANAVSSTSGVDGFLGNALIRIALPEEFEGTASALRTVGLGGKVDELEIAMNRAAEHAAGEAGDVFLDAIRGLTFADAPDILQGDETAATDYLREQTSDELRTRFAPIVDAGMREVGLVQLYDGLIGRVRTIPFAPVPDLDLRRYVTGKGLDGLFLTLAGEEKRIREDPQARVTDLLARVFGP